MLSLIVALIATLPLFVSATPLAFSCSTRSRQMTLIKNCFTGDMSKAAEAKFFDTSPPEGHIAFCYNSMAQISHRPKDPTLHLQVLSETRDGQFHTYNYSLAVDELKHMKKSGFLVRLKNLKGRCYSPSEDRQACSGGFLKSIGLSDVDRPMVLAIGKTHTGQFSLKLLGSAKELENIQAKDLDPVSESKTDVVSDWLVQDVRVRLITAARAKISAMHVPGMTPAKLASKSEQFRYCSLALDNFVKHESVKDPLTPAEHNSLAALTNYMNGDVTPSREPASVPHHRK